MKKGGGRRDRLFWTSGSPEQVGRGFVWSDRAGKRRGGISQIFLLGRNRESENRFSERPGREAGE